MDDFAALPNAERSQYFRQAAAIGNINNPLVIEKDFWVTFMLRILFHSKKFNDWFTFKGGTSLSKIYKVIYRFSEDIDVSIDRSALGFGGENDPKRALTFTKTKALLDELTTASINSIRNDILPMLEETCTKILGKKEDWKIGIDPSESQTILFSFPTDNSLWKNSYFKQDVKIEFGAKNETWPTQRVQIHAYLTEIISNAFDNQLTEVNVLNVERTFWEKATILHAYHHGGLKKIRPYQSRHYYDLYQLAKSQHCGTALKSIDLLEAVATHKSTFFRQGWAQYESARIGSLKLLPKDEDSLTLLVDDYNRSLRDCAPNWAQIPDILVTYRL
jgi:predicted nucleotidyltransferase component of viral defense system